MKRNHWFEIILAAILLAVSLYAAFSEAHNFPGKWFQRDDAYYYFKVAQNISEGHGVTFDGINPTNGFHPLWMLICIPIFSLARFDLILPLRILLVVMSLLCAGTGILMYRMVRMVLSEGAAIFSASLWCFSWVIYGTVSQMGLETGLTAFAIILLLYQLARLERCPQAAPVKPGRIALLALAGIFVLFSRLDTIFLVLAAGLWIVFRQSPLRVYLQAELLTVPVIVLGAVISRTGLPHYYSYSDATLLMIAISLVVRIPLNYFAGLYQNPSTYSPRLWLKRIALTVTGGSVLISAVMLTLLSSSALNGFPRGALLVEWGLSLVAATALRLGWLALKQRGQVEASPDPVVHLKSSWKRWLTEGLIYFGIVGIALGIYMGGNQLAFGTPMPVSGQIKQWWGEIGTVYGGTNKTLTSIFGVDPRADFAPWKVLLDFPISWADQILAGNPDGDFGTVFWALTATLLVVGAGILLLNRKRSMRAFFQAGLIPLFVSAELQVLYYSSGGYAASKGWYWVAQMIWLVLVAALLAEVLIGRVVPRPAGNRVKFAAAILFAVFIAGRFSYIVVRMMPYQTARPNDAYMDILNLLEENTEPGAIIGMTGGGNVGYFIKDRTIVNMDGLINSPAYFRALQEHRGGEYLEAMGLDYVFANPDILETSPVYRHIVKNREMEGIATYGRKILMRFGTQKAVP
jgi:hypothetical protein